MLSTTSLYQNTLNEERSLLEKKNIKNQILLFEYLKNIYSKKILVPSTSENKVDFLLKNSYLNVDAVFSPVTKVSYIIELNENRLMKKAKIKEQFIHDIFTLLDSHLFLQKKLPFLTKLIPTVINPFKNSTTNKAFANIVGVKKRNKSRTINEMGKCMSSRGQMPDAFGTVSASLHADLPAAELNIDSSSFGENAYPFEKQIVPILTLLNNFNTGNIITLEIWTNGSLHPKEALATAFSTLATLFLNMKKTNIYNSIYKDSVSYQKSLTKPLTNQSAYVQRHPLFEVGSEGVSSLSVTAPRVSGFLKGPSPAKMPKVSAVLRAGPNIVRQPFILTSCGLPPRGPGAAIEPQDVRMKGCLPAAFQPNVYGPSPKTTYKSAQEIRKLLFSPDPRRGKKQSFRNSCSFTQPVLSSLSTNSTLIKKNDIDISFLNLNMRAYTILKRANIKTVSILSKITVVELFEKYKLDKQTIQNIKNSLNALNYLF
uniref:RNA polymerase alpha protein n=1 Tax=Haematococcus lacustris TaxID=44745 RepID=A0A2K9YRJ7_HAELA|nr:RNA polymerase alpha protein [Haematococcus lacustris]AUW36432.1 RNA polymerase alpha protein [Haematococcus lacustris]